MCCNSISSTVCTYACLFTTVLNLVCVCVYVCVRVCVCARVRVCHLAIVPTHGVLEK